MTEVNFAIDTHSQSLSSISYVTYVSSSDKKRCYHFIIFEKILSGSNRFTEQQIEQHADTRGIILFPMISNIYIFFGLLSRFMILEGTYIHFETGDATFEVNGHY